MIILSKLLLKLKKTKMIHVYQYFNIRKTNLRRTSLILCKIFLAHALYCTVYSCTVYTPSTPNKQYHRQSANIKTTLVELFVFAQLQAFDRDRWLEVVFQKQCHLSRVAADH